MFLYGLFAVVGAGVPTQVHDGVDDIVGVDFPIFLEEGFANRRGPVVGAERFTYSDPSSSMVATAAAMRRL